MSDTSFTEDVAAALANGDSLVTMVRLLAHHKVRGLMQSDAVRELDALRATAANDSEEDSLLELMDIVLNFCAPRHRVWPDEEE